MSDRGYGCCEGGRPSLVAASWGQRLLALWYGIDHQRVVRDGSNLNALLQEPAEEESPALRLSPVETERELVEVGLKVVSLHRALMRAQQPSLGEAGDPMHAWKEHMSLHARAGHVDRAVDVVGPNRQGGTTSAHRSPPSSLARWSPARTGPARRSSRWGSPAGGIAQSPWARAARRPPQRVPSLRLLGPVSRGEPLRRASRPPPRRRTADPCPAAPSRCAAGAAWPTLFGRNRSRGGDGA